MTCKLYCCCNGVVCLFMFGILGQDGKRQLYRRAEWHLFKYQCHDGRKNACGQLTRGMIVCNGGSIASQLKALLQLSPVMWSLHQSGVQHADRSHSHDTTAAFAIV